VYNTYSYNKKFNYDVMIKSFKKNKLSEKLIMQ